MVKLLVAFVYGSGMENEHVVCYQSCEVSQFPNWQRELLSVRLTIAVNKLFNHVS